MWIPNLNHIVSNANLVPLPTVCLTSSDKIFDTAREFFGFIKEWLKSKNKGYYDPNKFEQVP